MNKPMVRTATGVLALISLLVIGTSFYMHVEKWSMLDSLLNSASIIATLGYSPDFYPQTDIGKIFTIFYMFIGIGVVLTIAMNIGATYMKEISKIEHESFSKSDKLFEKVKRDMLIRKYKHANRQH
jgi:voltage-gated potassium channel